MTFFHFSYKNRGRKSPTPSSSTEGSRGSAQTPSSMKSFQNNAQAPSSTTKNFQNIAQAPRGPPQYQYSSPSLRQNVPVDAAASIPPPYAAPQPAPPLNPLWCPPPTYQQFHEQQQQYLEATRQQRIQAEWMASQPQPPFRTNPTSRPASFHQHFHQHQQHQYINGMGQQGPHTDWTTNPLNLPMRPSTATRPPSFHQSFLQQHQHQYVDGTRQQRPQAEWMSSPLYMPVRSNTATPPSPLQNHYAASLDQTYPNPMYQSYPYNPPNHPMTPRAAATFPQPQLSQLMYASPAPLTPLTPQQTGPLQPQPQPYYVKTKPSGAALSSIYKPIKKASTTMLNLQHSVMENKGGGLIEKADTWYESVSTKLDDMITGMDEEQFVAEEGEDNTRASTAKHIYDKVWRYQNSRLPPDMPPCEIPIACWPLINLAAKYSEKVYTDPQARAEKKMYVSAGAKPMFMKSVTRDDQKVVILAIRGTKRFKDWCVNFRDRGVDPKGFLDDPTQKCHAGFLDVAKSMIKPIAEHLDHLLAEDPSRSRCSLLLTGHSAGGAVASLLYAHLASSAAISPFHTLMRKFKRVHCVTFGTPPCTLFPLAKPEGEEWVRSIFVTFVNEGDPVPRADRSVLGSLLDLYRQPAPKIGSTIQWRVPPGEMNLPGSLVVMRTKPGSGGPVLSVVNVEAISARNQDLRTVMYGDPLAHQMVLYQKRVQELATRSATARDD